MVLPMRLAALILVLADFGGSLEESLTSSPDASAQQSLPGRDRWNNFHQTSENRVSLDAGYLTTARHHRPGAQLRESPLVQFDQNGSSYRLGDSWALQTRGPGTAPARRQAKAPAHPGPLAPPGSPAPPKRAVYPLRPGPQNLLTVEVDKTGFLRGRTHVFVVQRFTGRVEYDPAQPALSRVELDVETSGVSSSDAWLNRSEWKRVMEYATSPAVLDALAHPLVSFRSTAIEPAGPGRFRISGPLQIRGRALPSSFDATLKPLPGGALRAGGTAAFPMSRYGIEPYKEFWGIIGTRDEIRVRFQFHLVPEKP
jgi:polyisoprenoid-binding protein YceI